MNAIRCMSTKLSWGLAMMGVSAAMSVSPATAKADRWGVSVSLGGQPTYVPPAYETQARTVTTPAVFETQTRRVWIEPVYENRQVLIEIPARTAVREMPRRDYYGRVVGYERVVTVVEPARREWRTKRVLVQPGRWETVTEQVCVRPESSEVVYDNVQVSPGYWTPSSGISFGYAHGHHHDHGVRVIRAATPYGPHRGVVRVRR